MVRVLGARAQARGVDVSVLPHQPGHVLGRGVPVGRPGRHTLRLPVLQAALAPARARAAGRLRSAERPRVHRPRAAARLRPPLPRSRRRRRVVRPDVHRDHGSAAHQDVRASTAVTSTSSVGSPARSCSTARPSRSTPTARARPLVGIAQPVRSAPHVGGGVEGDADAVQPRHVRHRVVPHHHRQRHRRLPGDHGLPPARRRGVTRDHGSARHPRARPGHRHRDARARGGHRRARPRVPRRGRVPHPLRELLQREPGRLEPPRAMGHRRRRGLGRAARELHAGRVPEVPARPRTATGSTASALLA